MDYLLSQIASGNFNTHSNAKEAYKGNFVSLLVSLRNIRNNLSDTIGQINITANQVLSSSGQVANGAQTLNQSATEQASSIESFRQQFLIFLISFQVKTNTDNANKAKETSLLSSSQVTNSNQKMQEMIHAMDIISSKSDEISKIR